MFTQYTEWAIGPFVGVESLTNSSLDQLNSLVVGEIVKRAAAEKEAKSRLAETGVAWNYGGYTFGLCKAKEDGIAVGYDRLLLRFDAKKRSIRGWYVTKGMTKFSEVEKESSAKTTAEFWGIPYDKTRAIGAAGKAILAEMLTEFADSQDSLFAPVKL